MKKILTILIGCSCAAAVISCGSGGSGSSNKYLPVGYYYTPATNSTPVTTDGYCADSTSMTDIDNYVYINSQGLICDPLNITSCKPPINLNNTSQCYSYTYTPDDGVGIGTSVLNNCQFNSTTGVLSATEVSTSSTEGVCTQTVQVIPVNQSDIPSASN